MNRRFLNVVCKAAIVAFLAGVCFIMMVFGFVMLLRFGSETNPSVERLSAPDGLVDGDLEMDIGREWLIVTLWAEKSIYIDPGSVRLAIVEISDKNGSLAMRRGDMGVGAWRFSDATLIQVPMRNHFVSSPLRFTFSLHNNGLERCLPLMKSLGAGGLKVYLKGTLYSDSNNGEFEQEISPSGYIDLRPHTFTYETMKGTVTFQAKRD